MAYSWPSVWYVSQGDGSTLGYYAVAKWQASHAYSAGALVRQNATPSIGNERVYVCIIAGTSGSSEPSWGVTKGYQQGDGSTIYWCECTGQPGVNGDLTNCPQWQSGTAFTGLVIYDPTSGSLQMGSDTGAGGSTKPTFSATAGTITLDGSFKWYSLGPASNFGAWAAPHAWTTNATAWGAAGNTFYIADNSNEYRAGNYTVDAPTANPASLTSFISVSHSASLPPTSSTLSAGAIWACQDNDVMAVGTVQQNSYFWGISINVGESGHSTSNGTVQIGEGSAQYGMTLSFENCKFGMVSTSTGTVLYIGSTGYGNEIYWRNCTANFAASGQSVFLRNTKFEWRNDSGTAALGVPSTGSGYPLFSSDAYAFDVSLEGLDFSATIPSGHNVWNGQSAYGSGNITLKNCKLPSGGAGAGVTAVPATSQGVNIDVINSDTSGTNYRNERYTCRGSMYSSTAVYRSGGASDGATAVAHKIVTTADAFWPRPFESWDLAIWNATTGSNVTVTLYGCALAVSAIPNNDDAWMDVQYLGASGSPIASLVNTTKANAVASNAALSSDTSTWVATARANSTAYSVGQIMQPTGDSHRVYVCTTAGTSASSEPGGYASASDGSSVTDGSATFQACYRFKIAVTLSSPQPAQAGYIYVRPKFAKQSTTFLIDPLVVL